MGISSLHQAPRDNVSGGKTRVGAGRGGGEKIRVRRADREDVVFIAQKQKKLSCRFTS